MFWIILSLCVIGISCQFDPPIGGLRTKIDDKIRDDCNYAIDRYKSWDDGTLQPLADVEYLHEFVHEKMYDSFTTDISLFYKMDNYSRYFNDTPHVRGLDADFEDCLDLCPSQQTLMGGIYLPKVEVGVDYSLCLIPYPRTQRVFARHCSGLMNLEIPRTDDFQNRYECVPDGFITRKIIAYCPQAPKQQCREATVDIPMACSPKLAKCVPTLSERRKTLLNLQKHNKHHSIGSRLLGNRIKSKVPPPS